MGDRVLSPDALSLKIPSWRKWQPDIVESTLDSFMNGKRFVGHCLSTGAGKSEIGLAVAETLRLAGEIDRAAILTINKPLQDQYMRSGELLGMLDVRGKGNYECSGWPGYSCEQAWPMCGAAKLCTEYQEAKDAATQAPVFVTNYDYWTRVPSIGAGVGLVVMDEVQDVADVVCDAMTAEVSAATFKWLGAKFELPVAGKEMDYVPVYTSEVAGVLERLSRSLRVSGRLAREEAMKLVAAQRLQQSLSNVRAFDGNWASRIDEAEEGKRSAAVVYAPIRPGKYTEQVLFQGVKYVLFMSATIRRRNVGGLLGVAGDKLDFTDHPAVFKPGKRPVVWVKTARLNERNKAVAWPEVMKLLEEMVKTRAAEGKRRGIIHTGSYPRMWQIVKGSRYKDLMVWHEDARGKDEALKKYAASTPGGRNSVLVSPSVDTGYDFPDDAARWQFICKIPFIAVKGDAIVEARNKADEDYAMGVAMSKFIQMCGRIVRNELDWGETVVADDSVGWFMGRYARRLAPEYFKVAGPFDELPELMPVGGW